MGGFHSFRASGWQHHLYHSVQVRLSTLHDRSRPSNSGVLTLLRARDHAGPATFMRSTPDCGTSAGDSLELEGFRSQKQKGSAESPDLKHPGALGKPDRPARVWLKRCDKYIPGTYTCAIKLFSQTCFLMGNAVSHFLVVICACEF